MGISLCWKKIGHLGIYHWKYIISILDLDTHKVKVMFRIVVKDQLLKKKLYGDIDNAENQVFEE